MKQKRFVAMLLTVAMVLSLLISPISAVDTDTDTDGTEVTEDASNVTETENSSSTEDTSSDDAGTTDDPDEDDDGTGKDGEDDDDSEEAGEDTESGIAVVSGESSVSDYGDIEDYGDCGDDVIWTLYEDGTLVVSGEGDMWDNPDIDVDTDEVSAIVIEDGVEYIGSYSFDYWPEVETLDLGSTVTEIGEGAFEFCTSLTSVVIPASVESIDRDAFWGCENLETVTFEDGSSLTYIGAWAFQETALTCITIPESVEYIDEGAFWYCTSLESVYFESEDTEYADNAFEGCPCLQQLYVGWLNWSDEGWYFDLEDCGWSTYYGHYPCYDDTIVFFTAELDDDGDIESYDFVDPDDITFDWTLGWETFAEADDYSAADEDNDDYFVHVISNNEYDAWNQDFYFTYDGGEEGYIYGVLEGGSWMDIIELFTEAEYDVEYLVEYVYGDDWFGLDEDSDYVFYMIADPDDYYTITDVSNSGGYDDYIGIEKISSTVWEITINPEIFEESGYDNVDLSLDYDVKYYRVDYDDEGDVSDSEKWTDTWNLWHCFGWTGNRLGVRQLPNDGDGLYAYDPVEDNYVSTNEGVWPGDSIATIFYLYKTDVYGNVTEATPISADALEYSDDITLVSFGDDDIADYAENSEYYYELFMSEDADWETDYEITCDDAPNSVIINTYVGGINLFTHSEWDIEYLVDVIADGDWLSYNADSNDTQTEDSDYIFFLIADPDDYYSITYVDVNEYPDYVKAVDMEDGTYKIIVDSDIFADNNYEDVALNLTFGVSYYRENEDGEVEDEWTSDWGCYYHLTWTGWKLGMDWLSDDGDGWYARDAVENNWLTTDEGTWPGQTLGYVIFYLYKTDSEGNISEVQPVSADDLNLDDELELIAMTEDDYDFAEDAEYTDYYYEVYISEDADWNEYYEITCDDAANSVYINTNLGGIQLFTENDYAPENLAALAAEGGYYGWCFEYNSDSDDEDYVFYLLVNPDEYYTDTEDNQVYCYSIDEVYIWEYEDYITADALEDGSGYVITISSDIFAANNYEQVCLNFTWDETYYRVDSWNDDGEAENWDEWGANGGDYYTLTWTGDRLGVRWVDYDDGYYVYDPEEYNYISTEEGIWPGSNGQMVFYLYKTDAEGNITEATPISADDLTYDTDLMTMTAMADNDDYEIRDDADYPEYYYNIYMSEDAAWESVYEITYTDAPNAVYINTYIGGVELFTENEWDSEYLAYNVAEDGWYFEYGSSSDDDKYVFYLIADPDDCYEDADGKTVLCYSIEYVTVNEYGDYITAEELETGVWKITVDPDIFADNNYENVCLNLNYGVYYYYASYNDEGELEWDSCWDEVSDWGSYYTLTWSDWKLGYRDLNWYSTDDEEESEGWAENVDNDINSSSDSVYPGNAYAWIFYLYKTDADGNVLYTQVVDPDDLTLDDGVNIVSLEEYGWDIAEIADSEEYDVDNSAYYVVLTVDDWETTYYIYYGDYSTYVASYVNSCEWYYTDDFGNGDAVATETVYYTPASDEGTYIYLAQYYESSHGDYTFLPVISDENGTWLFYVGEDGTLDSQAAYDYQGDDADLDDWVADWEAYYSNFTFEWVTNDAGTGIKITLTDEAIADGFDGDVWININWIADEGEEYENQWTWGTWSWYFYPGGQVLYSETDVLADFDESSITDWLDLADWDDVDQSTLQTAVNMVAGEDLTGYLYVLDWFDDDDGTRYWKIASIDGINVYYSEAWGREDPLDWYPDDELTLTENEDGSYTISAEESGSYEIWTNGSYWDPLDVDVYSVTVADSSSSDVEITSTTLSEDGTKLVVTFTFSATFNLTSLSYTNADGDSVTLEVTENDDGSYTVEIPVDDVDPDTAIELSTELTEINYTLSYNSNGGKGTMATQTATAGSTVTVAKNSFTRSGYSFSSWNTKADGSGITYKAVQSLTLDSNITLYAQWSYDDDYYYYDDDDDDEDDDEDEEDEEDEDEEDEDEEDAEDEDEDSEDTEESEEAGSETEETVSFIDVSDSAYYADAVAWAVSEGIINGTTTTTFSPDDALTRAQLVTILYRLSGQPTVDGLTTPFGDIDGSSVAVYYDAIVWAYNAGIAKGTSDTEFSPMQTVTRAEVVTFLHRYYDEPTAEAIASALFTDVADSAYYADAVAWAVENGITTGTTTTTFSPDQYATRAQFVTFLYRAEN